MKQWQICLECGAINEAEATECLSCCYEDFCVCNTWEEAVEASAELTEDCHEGA